MVLYADSDSGEAKLTHRIHTYLHMFVCMCTYVHMWQCTDKRRWWVADGWWLEVG